MKALIFDFDGLILDTEMPRYAAWQEIYARHNCSLEISEFAAMLGSDDSNFDFHKDLEQKFGQEIDWESITPKRIELNNSLLKQEEVLPGVRDYILRGKELGLKVALASSSPKCWIERNLPLTGLAEFFDLIVTLEETGKAKPDPALFNVTLEKLLLSPNDAIVFEDSPNGCKAAERAGIFCVAVPNRITKCLNFDKPDLLMNSMTEISLESVIELALQKRYKKEQACTNDRSPELITGNRDVQRK